jgi:hypothetical protein
MGMETMFAVAGKECRATLESVTIHFYGILDRVQVEDEDETGRYVRNDSALRVNKETAQKFIGRSMIPVKIEGKDFVITECKLEDDGETALCLVVPVNEEDAC